ncbi:MAG TPA: hypothetical protein VFM48_08360 [Aquabacterium sp.]|nr:hypothetical protein [Aquabacterium sp.]
MTLKAFFSKLTDEELIAKVQSGLTTDAYAIARDELERRGLECPPLEEPQEPDEPYLGDMVLLASNLKPTEAHILASCLASAGIQAVTGDTNTVQANSLWSIALGGAKVRVPQSQLLEAKLVLNAFRRGDFILREDFDVGDGCK